MTGPIPAGFAPTALPAALPTPARGFSTPGRIARRAVPPTTSGSGSIPGLGVPAGHPLPVAAGILPTTGGCRRAAGGPGPELAGVFAAAG